MFVYKPIIKMNKNVQYRMINVSETLPLRTIKVNKGEFTLEIGPLNGSYAFFVIKIAKNTNSFRYLPD